MSPLLVVALDCDGGPLKTDSEGLCIPGTSPPKFKPPPDNEPCEEPPAGLPNALAFDGVSEDLDASTG